jgi:FlaA1/EpsC-like NDP-sugar epimerase
LAIWDLVGSIAALVLAYSIRFESIHWPAGHAATFWRFLPIALVVNGVVFFATGLYRRLWRHAGLMDLGRLLVAAAIAGGAIVGLGVWLLPSLGVLAVRLPVSVAVLEAALTLAVIALPRLVLRWGITGPFRPARAARRAVIAGAGAAGELIAKELLANPELGLRPVGFLDDDPSKHGQMMCGLKVLGPVRSLSDHRVRLRIEELIIAMPSAPGSVVREAMRIGQTVGIVARTIPGVFEILTGRVRVSSLRPIQIDDLLRRAPVRIDLDRVQEMVSERTVLVTGAGGSIGSELSRQLAAVGPGRLILLGHGENSIFTITSELTERHPSLEVIPLIADVRDREGLLRRLAPLRPAVVFHAAAHKHVPLMEVNAAESVTNNVGGTVSVAQAALELGSDRLVLVSTDKAVRPTNVMGATKRIAEQVVQALAERHGRNFISVRFGNVLGSRGSVVPVFLRQIAAGGPVTVTHPEMRRYFMTIPESVQLTQQAAVLGQGGEVFVLDMGNPIKIVDLAADLIRLSGFEVGRDIEIHFTGVRPGEKLYEELFFGREFAEPTPHPKVLRAKHDALSAGALAAADELIAAAHGGAGEAELRDVLRRLVPDYRPENSAHHVLVGRTSAPTTASPDR